MPKPPRTTPLAESMRPSRLDQVVGQSHLLGPGKPLRLAFESGKPHSMILWGPPGVGKTTIARLAAESFDYEFIALSAVFSGVRDIRAAMEQAESNRTPRERPSCSSTRSTGSTRASRMGCFPTSSPGW